MEARGDTVFLRGVQLRSVPLALLGLAVVSLEEESYLVVEDGLATAIQLSTPSPVFQTRLDSMLANARSWLQHEYPQRLGRVWQDGSISYGPRTAGDWIALLNEWRTGER